MSNLIPLDEAARMLGLDSAKLNDLRLQNAILGVRDGSVWKFKREELDRYAADHGIQLGGADDAEDLDFELSSGDLSSGSIDVAGSSDDLILKDSDSLDLSDELKDSSELSFGSSDIALAADSAIGDEELDAGSGGTGKDKADPLAEKGAMATDDSVELASDFDESDLVLDDSDSSNEVALEANDSGINLSPTDSGISLDEQPMELGGSDIDSLELPEDDDAISLEEAADYDSATELRAEDDFNLTPLEESLEDESSGSQVIALEDSDLFTDDSAPTILGDSDVVQQPALIADDASLESPVGTAPVASAPAVPEAPYSIMQVLSLAGACLITMLCAVVAFDLARNMWQGSDSPPLTATVMNFFVRLAGWNS